MKDEPLMLYPSLSWNIISSPLFITSSAQR
jgi:hypothetical protein